MHVARNRLRKQLEREPTPRRELVSVMDELNARLPAPSPRKTSAPSEEKNPAFPSSS